MSYKINENTYWVGKVDDRDVPFHRLILTKGTTYNSYLLKTDKPTIIDTVDISFAKEYVENLEKEIDLLDIEYIVINHTEPDHSGGLRLLASRAKNAIIVCTEHAVYELKEMYKLHDREFKVVKSNDKLDIGGKTLHFIETPYLHTEETMLTFCEEDKILYSCDVFSTHIAKKEYLNEDDIIQDYKTYYELIMHPHRLYVQDMISKIKNLDIEIIAPSHGYILKENAKFFINIYDEMSKNTLSVKKGLVLYSSMTGNTKAISEEIQKLYNDHELSMELINVNKTSVEEILPKINDADILFFGTSTKYADMIGKLEDVLKELSQLDLSNKIGIAFGSYGWSGEPIEIVQDYLNETNLKVLSTSEIIKSTGMTDVQFPIRLRFSLSNKNKEILKRAVYYTIDVITS